jgi:phage recombination protein Bet
MKWADEKADIVAALKEKGYSDEKQKDVYQLIDKNNPMIPTVNIKSQPKAGEHIPVYFINTEDLEGEYLQDVNGQLGAAKQLIRNAKNGLETEQKQVKSETSKPQPILKKQDIKPIKEVPNIPMAQPPTAVQLTGQVKLSVEIIQQYINSDATMEQAFNFMAFCEAQNLDPFKQEAHLIIFGGKANNVIGVDGNIKRAQEQPDYDGYEAGIIVKKEDGSLDDERVGTFLLEEETLLGGWCKVYRKNITYPFVSKVTLKEYIQLKKDGTPNKIWEGKPATMICKVPISQCHRKAYAGLNGGGYELPEMTDLGDVEVIE